MSSDEIVVIIVSIIMGIIILASTVARIPTKKCVERDYTATTVPFKFSDGNRLDYERDYPCKRYE